MNSTISPNINEQLEHLEAEYRYLSQACYAWNKLVVNPTTELTKYIDTEFAELSTIIQDSILVHTRTLIEYYKGRGRSDDIKIQDILENQEDSIIFCNYICDNNLLQNLKKQIEVHFLHITYNRDLKYRSGQSANKGRPNFNEVNASIFPLMLELLSKLKDNVKYEYKYSLKKLYKMAKNRYKKGSEIDWKGINWSSKHGHETNLDSSN